MDILKKFLESSTIHGLAYISWAKDAIQSYNLTLNNKSRMIIIFSSLNHWLFKMTASQRAERLLSMRFEKIMILFFGLFLGFLFYPLLITPFPKVSLTKELKILVIEDAWRWGGYSLSLQIYQGWCWCILSPRCPSTVLRLQISLSLSSELLDQGLAYFALFSLPQVFALLHFSS